MFQGEIASQDTTDTVPDTVTLDTANALREEAMEILVTKAMSPLLAKLLHAAAVSPDGTARIMIGRPNPLSKRSATGQSCASPPVNRMAISRPLASASAWIFVLRPPRERPTACFCSPLFRPMPSDAP